MRPPPKLLGRGFPVFTNAELEPGAGPCGRRFPGEILAFSIVKLTQASDKILAAFKCAQAAMGKILQKLCLPCARSSFREMCAMRGDGAFCACLFFKRRRAYCVAENARIEAQDVRVKFREAGGWFSDLIRAYELWIFTYH